MAVACLSYAWNFVRLQSFEAWSEFQILDLGWIWVSRSVHACVMFTSPQKNQFLVWEAAASYGMVVARKLLEMIFLFSKPQAQEMEKKFLFAISLSSAEQRKAWQFEKSECFFRVKIFLEMRAWLEGK